MDETSARLQYGRVVVVELDGHELLFRPLTPAEAARAADSVTKAPEIAVETALATCEAACLTPEPFVQLADNYPLAFSGEDGVFGELLRLAQGDAVVRVKTGARLWKAADRNPGKMAENLLAFKAYQGGDWGEKEFAGALTIAEWMSSTKGLFQLFLALMKSLSRKRK